jgi:hypothetical protein
MACQKKKGKARIEPRKEKKEKKIDLGPALEPIEIHPLGAPADSSGHNCCHQLRPNIPVQHV